MHCSRCRSHASTCGGSLFRGERTRIAAGARRTRSHAVDRSLCDRRSSLRRDGPCPNCPLTAWAALPFSFLTSQISAEPAMRCGSEPSRRIDPRDMLDARALCLSLLFCPYCLLFGVGAGQ